MAIRETQVHILVGCGDARDHVPVHVDAQRAVQLDYATRGIDARVTILRVPGSFITNDVVTDIRRIVDSVQRDPETAGRTLAFSVYIQTHGTLEEDPGEGAFVEPHRVRIVPGSPVNCGMLNATAVGLEIEGLLLDVRPEVSFAGRTLRVDGEAAIRTLLRECYAHDGYLAGDWIKSIDDLRTHTRAQKALLEQAIEREPDLRHLDIRISSGIQDYMRRRHVRIETGEGDDPFWDDLFAAVHQRSRGFEHDPDGGAPKQAPLGGLLAVSDHYSPRLREEAADYFARRAGGQDASRLYSVFAMGGNSFDIPHSRFGPYIIAGFFYSVKYLKVTDYLVYGGDEAQTKRMLAKIDNDPIMRLVVGEYGVNLVPVTPEEIARGGPVAGPATA